MALTTRWCAGLLLVLAGCSPERTEILVVVDTDLAAPSEIDRIRFDVTGPRLDYQAAVANLSGGGQVPAVLGLYRTGGPLQPLQITVTGERGGSRVLSRQADTAFVRGQTLMLSMHLVRRCIGVTCGPNETCSENGCRSTMVPPEELVAWTGVPDSLEGGAGDAGDAEPQCPGGCDDGVECTVDSCHDMTCTHAPDPMLCPLGELCVPETGCARVDCMGDPDCANETVCDGLETCVDMTCRNGTPLDCDDEVGCTMDGCDMRGGCRNVPDAAACDDTIACTIDACDPVAGCTNVPDATLCDDGIPCTTDRCDGVAGCSNIADPRTCPAGEWCDVMGARACTAGATFTEIYAIVTAQCGPCHLTRDRGGLDMSTRALAYSELVGITAECGGGLNTRVVAFDSRQSLLWRKVSGVDLCGARMPFGGDLSAADAARIASWIDSGALDN